MTETTEDGFLDGRLRILQPKAGYRAGMDPVLLAAAVKAKSGQSVLELGCGVGVALLCLKHRLPGLKATGVEVQASLAELAGRNAAANGLDARIVSADIAELPQDVRDLSFDHVIANPPYFERSSGSTAPDASREAGRGERLPLSTWIDVGIRRLAPGGHIWIIQRAARLPDMLAGLDARVGHVTVLPLVGRAGRPPETVIVSAKKGGRGAFRLLAPVVLHTGAAHEDGDRHTDLARRVLRDGAPLPMGDKG